jgi:hypothetical protein
MERSSVSRHLRTLWALVALLAVLAAACGDDDDDDTADTADTEATEDTEADDTEPELSDDEVLEEFCAIDADLDALDPEVEAAAEAEDLDAFVAVIEEGFELAGQAADLPLDQLEPGLEDDLATYLDQLEGVVDELADAADFDEAVEIVSGAQVDNDSLEAFSDDNCEGSDDTTPETDDTTPGTGSDGGPAESIVAALLGGTPLEGSPEAECIVEELEAAFDADELGALRVASEFTEEEAQALSDVFETCLPYQDFVATGISGQLGDELVEECVIDSYAGYDWVPLFTDPQAESAVLQDVIQSCTEAASGDAGAPTPNPPGTVVSLLEPNVGDCFDTADATGAEYTVVDCVQPHDREIFALFDLPDGAFPGEDAVREEAVAGCIAEFEAYVGTPYEESALFADEPIVPSAGSWDAGDREVICLLRSPDGQIEGSGYQSGA